MQSHPTWVRGLKLVGSSKYKTPPRVAPYVGAWIETLSALPSQSGFLVAPYVGAWIETISILFVVSLAKSHPTWVRGLKL